MDNTFPMKKTQLIWSWSCCDFAVPSLGVENQVTSIGTTGPLFPGHSCIHENFLRKAGSLVVVWVKSLATAARCSFHSGSRSHRTHFATTCFMPRSCIKISDTVIVEIPTSASSSHCQPSIFVNCNHTCSTFSRVLLVAGLPECGSLSRDSRTSLNSFYHTFICATLIASSPKACLIIWIFLWRNVQA